MELLAAEAEAAEVGPSGGGGGGRDRTGTRLRRPSASDALLWRMERQAANVCKNEDGEDEEEKVAEEEKGERRKGEITYDPTQIAA